MRRYEKTAPALVRWAEEALPEGFTVFGLPASHRSSAEVDCYLSFVVGPHSDHLHNSFFGQDLINQSVLDVYTAGTSAREIANQPLEWRGSLKWVFLDQLEERKCSFLQAALGDLSCIFLGMP